MKSFAILTAWTLLVGVIIHSVFSPQNGVMFQSPLAALSLGIIGLGLCMESKKQLVAVRVRSDDQNPSR